MAGANITHTILYIVILILAAAQTAMHITVRHWDSEGHFGHQKIFRTWVSRIGWAIVGILLGLYIIIHLIVKMVNSANKFVSARADVITLFLFLCLEILAVVLDGMSWFSTADIVTCLCGVAILGTLIFEIIYVSTRKSVGGRWSSSVKDLSSGW